MLEPPSDVNWLLSALAQASAAMIAIIGGLLVSRYVALHSEQEAARRRVADLQRRSAEASLRAEAASAELATYQIDDALLDSRVFNALANSGFDLTPSAALLAVDQDGDGLDEALLARRVAEISDDLEAAFDAIDPLVPESLNHESWTEFRQRHSLPVGNREVWEWAYDEVCDVQRERARAAEERSQPAWARGLSTNIAHDVALSSMRALIPAVGPHYEVARLSALRAAVDSADAHKRALEQERRLATETFEATRQPEGFGLALQVLSILAMLGMALPVIIMGFEVTTLPALSRAAVIFCFLGGVSLLLRFLFVYASFLREGGRAALPATALGLLLPARKKRGKRRAADLGPPS